jgi:hypothetical protein
MTEPTRHEAEIARGLTKGQEKARHVQRYMTLWAMTSAALGIWRGGDQATLLGGLALLLLVAIGIIDAMRALADDLTPTAVRQYLASQDGGGSV